MSERTKESVKFPILVLAITMLAPVVFGIGMVLWQNAQSAKPVEPDLPEAPPITVEEGEVRMIITAPGYVQGKLSLYKLDENDTVIQEGSLPVQGGLARGSVAFGEPPFSMIVRSPVHVSRRIEVSGKRITSFLEPGPVVKVRLTSGKGLPPGFRFTLEVRSTDVALQSLSRRLPIARSQPLRLRLPGPGDYWFDLRIENGLGSDAKVLDWTRPRKVTVVESEEPQEILLELAAEELDREIEALK